MTNPFQQNQPGFGTGQGGADVNRLHDQDDRDLTTLSHHHTLGIFPAQASPGDHLHDGKQSKKIPYTSVTGTPTVVSPSITLPVSEVGYGAVPAIGVGLTYARADHGHGTPKPPLVFTGICTTVLAPGTANADVVGMTVTINPTGVNSIAFIWATFFITVTTAVAGGDVEGELFIAGVAQAGLIIADTATLQRQNSSQQWMVGVGAGSKIIKMQGRRNASASASAINLTHSRLSVLLWDIP